MNTKAPEELSKNSKQFFKSILKEYELEAHHIEILTQACHALDRLQEAQKSIQKHGSYYLDRFKKPKILPAVEVEAKYMVIFKNLIRELGLDLEPPKEPGRPPGQY
jgi:P27 family predicted phage terminase small subunit